MPKVGKFEFADVPAGVKNHGANAAGTDDSVLHEDSTFHKAPTDWDCRPGKNEMAAVQGRAVHSLRKLVIDCRGVSVLARARNVGGSAAVATL